MAINLTPRWDDFAVYLPAIQGWYSTNVYSDRLREKSRPFPKGITLKDLKVFESNAFGKWSAFLSKSVRVNIR